VSLELAASVRKTVGAKQTLKAMKRNEVTQLYIANDCDVQVVAPLIAEAEGAHIPVDRAYTMTELGMACHIKVKAAAVGLLK
jgi:large subunit ribosomal protein L7A